MTWLLVLRCVLLWLALNYVWMDVNHAIRVYAGENPAYPPWHIIRISFAMVGLTAFIASMGWLTP